MASDKVKGLWLSNSILHLEDLTLVEKLVLADIEALAKGGSCIASNQYIADAVGLSKMQVRRAIYSLEEKGHIKSVIERDDMTRQVGGRKLYPMCKSAQGVCANLNTPYVQNCTEGMCKSEQRVCANLNTPYVQNCTLDNINNNIDNNINNNINNNTENNIAATRAREAEPVDNFVDVVNMYENTIRPIPNKIEQDNLVDLYDEFGAEWMKEAIREAGKSGGRSISYLAAILRRWEGSGLKEPWKKPYKKNVEETPTDRVNRILAELEEM